MNLMKNGSISIIFKDISTKKLVIQKKNVLLLSYHLNIFLFYLE